MEQQRIPQKLPYAGGIAGIRGELCTPLERWAHIAWNTGIRPRCAAATHPQKRPYARDLAGVPGVRYSL